ncbi:MAG: HD domain-containing protein [Candidatus Ranarchaeia archaeon]|jgi:putative hydrolase of HD superfamily
MSEDKDKQKFENLIETLNELNTLKEIPRIGWIIRGVPLTQAETIAEHSASLLWLAVTTLPLLEDDIKKNKDPILSNRIIDARKILEMVAIHDLPEVKTGDIDKQGAINFGPAFSKLKHQGETQCFENLTSDLSKSIYDRLFCVWEEYQKAESLEAKFVHQLDRIDASIQALTYIDMGHQTEKLETFFLSLESLKKSEFKVIREITSSLEEIIEKRKVKQ